MIQRFGLALLITVGFLLFLSSYFSPVPAAPIRIGVVHALSGPMADSERGLVDAIHLAVDKINQDGGILGRPLEMIVADSQSDESQAAQQVARLIKDEQVSAIFACWTSSCRKAVRPIVEEHRHLMFYPLQYEGMEQSPNIVYLGAAPNQQIIPGTRWAMERFGKRVYLLGSDYIFPRAANLLIRDLVQAADGEVLAERYLAMDATDFSEVLADIQRQAPDVILNTINGQANHPFFTALAAASVTMPPVLSFSVAEPELQAMSNPNLYPEHYAVWGYFQSLPRSSNVQFIVQFRERFGQARVLSDPIITSYNAVMLWSRAVQEAGSDAPEDVNRALSRVSLAGPGGIVALEASTRHSWRQVYVGKARPDGQFDAQEISGTPLRPSPFPPYRSQEYWQNQLQKLTQTQPAGSRQP